MNGVLPALQGTPRSDKYAFVRATARRRTSRRWATRGAHARAATGAARSVRTARLVAPQAGDPRVGRCAQRSVEDRAGRSCERAGGVSPAPNAGGRWFSPVARRDVQSHVGMSAGSAMRQTEEVDRRAPFAGWGPLYALCRDGCRSRPQALAAGASRLCAALK